MAAIDFPDSPAPDEEFLSPSGITYIWDAVDGKWRLQPAVAVKAPFQENLDTDAFKATAGTVNKHEVVHVTDWTTDGVPITVEQADASSGTLMPAGGIALEGFTDVAVGRVGLAGILKGFDTSAWAEGDRLWVDPASPGMFTNVRPVGAGEVVQDVGIVLEVGVSIGAISYSFFQTDKLNADDVFYDNATSGLVADDVQAAIDEVVASPLGTNLIMNGSMQVSQRGGPITHGPAISSDYSAADRWQVNISAGPAAYTSQVQGITLPDNSHRQALRIVCTVTDVIPGAGEYCIIDHYIEGQDLQHLRYGSANAQPTTASFWTFTDNPGVYGIALYSWSGARSYITEITLAASTWEFHTITIPGDVVATVINDNTAGIVFRIALVAEANLQGTAGIWQNTALVGTANQGNFADALANFYITGIMWNVGSHAAPFQHLSYGDELRRCQRYYEKFEGIDNDYFLDGWSITTEIGSGNFQYQTKRTAPTLVDADPLQFQISRPGLADAAVVSLSLNGPTTKSARLNVTTAGATQTVNDSFSLRGNLTPCSFALDAEL